MTNSNPYKRQIQNRNFLSPTGFKFSLQRCPQASFFANSCNFPAVTLGVAVQQTYLKQIDRPGDQLQFEDFSLRFWIDEDLENYMQIQNWMRGLGFPESLQQIYDERKKGASLYKNASEMGEEELFSDGTLQVLSNNLTPQFYLKFYGLFPVSLSTLQFDATPSDVDYFTADVTFKYTYYEVTDLSGRTL